MPTIAPVIAIDRADHIRHDPEALAAAMGARARLLLLDGIAPVFDGDDRLTWGSLADAPPDAELVFLGLDGERGCFAAVPRASDPAPLRKIRDLAGRLHEAEFGLYAAARSLVDWHARHRFCAQCGGHTVAGRGGWQRECSNDGCGASHYPRTDPVAIMTVEHRRRDGETVLLLGRQAGFPPGMYSALAGFAEPGETLEEAVARETYEEAGVRVRDVRYVASQPWPFPSQLMLGCHGFSDHDGITVDRNELEDARWFTAAEVAAAMSAAPDARFSLPPAYAIAHRLIADWLNDQSLRSA